jgi:hypothetical protein
MTRGALPCNQLASQNSAMFPLPIVTIVDALKSWRSTSFTGNLPPTQGRSGSFHSNHSHRNLSGRLNLSRSHAPKPPSFFGLCSFFHCTRQFPPFALLVPFHRNPLLILSICLVHFFSWKFVRKYVGIEDSTEFTKVRRPALFKNFPFQGGSLAASLSSSSTQRTMWQYGLWVHLFIPQLQNLSMSQCLVIFFVLIQHLGDPLSTSYVENCTKPFLSVTSPILLRDQSLRTLFLPRLLVISTLFQFYILRHHFIYLANNA